MILCVCLFSSYRIAYVYAAFSKGHKSENKPSQHAFYPSGHKYKALLFLLLVLVLLLCAVLSHYRCRFSAKLVDPFFSSLLPRIYIRSVHQMRTSKLFEQKKNFLRLFLTRTYILIYIYIYIYILVMEKK
jgi:hypothetical protein